MDNKSRLVSSRAVDDPASVKPLSRRPIVGKLFAVAAYPAKLAVLIVLFTSLLFAYHWYRLGSRSLVLPYLKGSRFFVYPTEASFGSGTIASNLEVPVTVANFGSRPVQLLGVRTDCSCVTTETFPISIGPGQTRRVPLSIHLADKPGPFEQNVVYYSDSSDNPRAKVRVSGVITQ